MFVHVHISLIGLCIIYFIFIFLTYYLYLHCSLEDNASNKVLLVNYGVDRFAEVFVGATNYDNPEVIWTLEMRQHLVDMIQQHLGDFPQRLQQHTTAQYEHCPIPRLAYPSLNLQQDLFCHNYYLRNLCDETRFPQWPIKEPLEVFRSCLQL